MAGTRARLAILFAGLAWAGMLEEDACVQKNWHAVREWLYSQISKEPPHWDARHGLMGMSDLLQRVPSAGDDWQVLEDSACPMGEIALLVADFLRSGDRSLLELGLIMMRRTAGLNPTIIAALYLAILAAESWCWVCLLSLRLRFGLLAGCRSPEC